MKKRWLRLISIVCSLAITAQCLPVVALDNNAEDLPVPPGPVAEEQKDIAGDAAIQWEETELRERSVKHFRLEGGLMLAAQYPMPVHYQSEDGAWVEYDNSLTEETMTPEEAAEALAEEPSIQQANAVALAEQLTADDLTEYANKQSDLPARLAKMAKQNKMFTLTKDGRELSWGYEDANKSRIEIVENTLLEGLSEREQKMAVPKVSQEAWYRELYAGVDLQVYLLPTGLKENLILKDKGARRTFEMAYKTDGLTPVQVDARTIALQNEEGETVYTLSAPVMTDAEGASSDALTLTLKDVKNKKFTVELTADDAWLDAEDRVYPVKIDPDTSVNGTDLLVFSFHTGTNTANRGEEIYIGNGDNSIGQYDIYVKAEALPTLSAGDMVVDARYTMIPNGYIEGGRDDVQINAHRITSAWSGPMIVTGNIPSYDKNVADYVISDEDAYWVITEMVRGWYLGTYDNYGLVLKSGSNGKGYIRYINAAGSQQPNLLITYRNQNGLEDYWSYESADVGMNGTLNVNVFNGNLVVTENVLSTTGSRLPVGISLVYNSNNHLDLMNQNQLMVGRGWQLSTSARMEETTETEKESGYYFVYVDGDGTRHYFRRSEEDSNTYVDEDGLGFTVTANLATITIKDKDGNISCFNQTFRGGQLSYIQDSDGNTMQFKYIGAPSGEQVLYQIVDGAGRTTALSHGFGAGEEYARVNYIESPDGEYTYFEYADGSAPTALTKVKYPDGTYTQYQYDGDGRLIKIMRPDGYRTEISYEDGRVKRIQELAPNPNGSGDEEGKWRSFTYYSYLSSRVTFDNTSYVYDFDSYGRTISINRQDGTLVTQTFTEMDTGNGTVAGANAAKNNKVTASSGSEKFVENLLFDPSAEAGGKFYVSGSESTVATDKVYIGEKSLKVSLSGTADSGFHAQRITLTGGKTVTLSAYVKTEDVVSVVENGGATMHIAWFNGDTYVGEKRMDYGLTGTTNDWVRLMLTADLPSGINEIGVYLDLKDATGTVWFDGIQLETGKAANRLNLLNDAEIFQGETYWTASSGSRPKFDLSATAIYITGAHNLNAYLYQTVPVNKADVCFNVYGTASAHSASTLHEDRAFWLELEIRYADGQGEWHHKEYSDGYAADQTVSFTAKPQRKGVEVESVAVTAVYRNNANTMGFGRAMLNVDMTGTTYDYDSEGNLISAEDNADRNQTYDYNDANELLKVVDAKNEQYSYTYASDNEHQLIAARSNQRGNGIVYSYDDYGNVTSAQTGTVKENGTLNATEPRIITAQSFNSTHNYVTEITDARGHSVNYTLNDDNGLVSKETSPAPAGLSTETVETTYSYNDRNPYLLGSMTRGNVSNYYGYDSVNRLTSIYHNGFNYNFSYDQWGKPLKTLIQNRLLFENEYEAANGNLLKTTYGNGDWWSFTYDNLDRVTAKASENGQAAEYAYNGQDQLVRLTDYLSGNTTEYTYDLLGRLTGSRTNGVNDVRAEYSYDKYNRWTGQTNITSGGSHAYGVDYGQDNLVSWSNQGRFSFNYDYDNLNRVTSEYLYVDGLYTRRYTQYTYTPGLFGSTSGLVSGMYFHSYDNEESLAYTYDDAGNISTIKENGVLKATYTYDQFGQLVREDNAWANKTYIYSYDAGGNLTMCREAPYTTGSITEYTGGATYTYATGTETDGSPVWKDLLTSYNGTAIKYDAIGNPLNWNGISNLAWSNGQRLTALRKGAMTVSYAYDETGLRTKKQVDLKTSLYDRDASGNLVHETRNNGQDHLYYYYDADGSIRSISYNGTRYAFRKNLQGDVIAILDTNGEVVARYTYDAWGKVLMVTDGNGNINTSSTFIGNVNPIRYRGYYYDTETGWYYLNSRYYDPQVRRFINADEMIHNGYEFFGCNQFAYGLNNPVNVCDMSGQSPEYITQQNDDTVVNYLGINMKMKYITWGTFGNIANNGCGAIAVYNALVSQNPSVSFTQVKLGLELPPVNGAFARGLLGTRPSGIIAYLKLIGKDIWVKRPDDGYYWGVTLNITQSLIVLHKNEGLSMHYVSGIRTGGEGINSTFIFYNAADMNNWNGTLFSFLSGLNARSRPPLLIIGIMN